MFCKAILGFTIAAIAAGYSGEASACDVMRISNESTLCLNEITIDGKSYSGPDIFYSASTKLKDNHADIVYSVTNVSTNNTPSTVRFLKGTADPLAFTTWTPTIAGADATAQAHYARDIVFGDFGNGTTSMYIADQSEYKSSTYSGAFNGVKQYVYTNDGSGNFTKTLLNFGVGSVHGPAVGNLVTDGFSIFFNNPFTSNANIAAAGGNIVTGAVQPIRSISGGKCFYSAAVMLKHTSSSGGGNSTKRDLICFSQDSGSGTANITNHRIFFNNGEGGFSKHLVLPTSAPAGWTVEDVVVGNFSGRSDGREDFVVLYVNRSVASTNPAFENTSLKIYVPDDNGVPHDRTADYFGAGCTACADFTNDVAKFHRIKGVDINNDGKMDLAMVREVGGSTRNPERQLDVLLNTSGSFTRETYTVHHSYMGYSIAPIGNKLMVSIGSKLYLGALK